MNLKSILMISVVALLTPAAAFAADAPGTKHQISANDLPRPYATPAADNSSQTTLRPDGVVCATFSRDAVGYSGYSDPCGKEYKCSRNQTAKLEIENINSALELFRLDVYRYPTQSEGLTALVVRPPSARGWKGPYLHDLSALRDPWGSALPVRCAWARRTGQSLHDALVRRANGRSACLDTL